jgi:protein-glutamine gamma-glutamyltransferase
MASVGAKPHVIPLPAAIDRYFNLLIYLLVLTGFGILASTGGVDLFTVVLVGAALATRGYLLARQQPLVIAERWTTPLTIAYLIFYGADYLIVSRSFLAATVHLVLFAVVIRTFSLRRERDYVTSAILAFLMVLASAVLTVDSLFLFFFTAFMLMAVATFILMEMRRSAQSARFQARHSPDAYEHRHLAFSLARVAPALAALILAGTVVVFFLLPRVSAGYLGAYSFATDYSAGFSDRVQLGRIGQIQQSDAVVMHIQIDGDQRGQYALHWRGVALAHFDGKSWSNLRQMMVLQRDGDGGFVLPPFSQGLQQAATLSDMTVPGKPSHLIHYRVLMEPIGTNVFFLAPWARRVSGAYRSLELDAGGAVTNIDPQRSVSVYEADSDIATPSAVQLRAAGNSLPPFAHFYLQLPRIDERIPRLATQIAGSAGNNYDKAVALESYLRTRYGYSLQLPRVQPADPLANFLFERRQGHCEYFASAMAVMLRTLKIPSRVVNGFRSDEFNDVTGKYVVRARDAHAWVEVYFPGYGWITFDPTPGGGVASPQGWERAMLYLDAAASFWREWVVSYDSSHQNLLGHAILSGTRTSVERTQAWARLRYGQLLNLARRGQRGFDHSPRRWVAGGAAVIFLLLLLANASRIARTIRSRQLRWHPERLPDQAAAMWYQRMARFLARRGLQKTASQTPQEFVRAIKDERLRARLGRFTDVYEAARFGSSSDDARRLPELYEEVEEAAKN